MNLRIVFATVLPLVCLCAVQPLIADTPPAIGPSAEALQQSRERAVRFLRNSQGNDGSWTAPNAPGICGLVTTALLVSGLLPDDPTVVAAVGHLETHIKPDGGVYATDSRHRNYETCIAMMAFRYAGQDRSYDEVLANAEALLRNLQWDQGEGIESSDPGFGGAGYGRHERPDLSNTSFLIEALHASGAGPDDPAMKKALMFVSRCQNLESEYNTTEFAAKINDGGSFYTAAAGGASQAGETSDGGLRSYGSMTYAALKSMIYAGLDGEDKRVAATVRWIRTFYTVAENPGLGRQGVYYYYHTFAKALDTLGDDFIEDNSGEHHDWRRELAEKLFELQRENGSWVNEAPRWYEGDPNLATAYSLLALSYCDGNR